MTLPSKNIRTETKTKYSSPQCLLAPSLIIPLPIFRPSYGPEKALRVMDDRLQHHGYQFARCTPLNFVLTTSWNVLLLSSIFQVSRAYVVLHNMRTKGPFIYNLFFTCLYPSKLSQAALGCVFLHFHRITKTSQNLRACCLKKKTVSAFIAASYSGTI